MRSWSGTYPLAYRNVSCCRRHSSLTASGGGGTAFVSTCLPSGTCTDASSSSSLTLNCCRGFDASMQGVCAVAMTSASDGDQPHLPNGLSETFCTSGGACRGP